jgi:predicted TIM-barrel fold metal-dependent hydrolase
VATVNPRRYFGSAEDMQAIRAQGFRIFKFYPGSQEWPVDYAAFGEALKQLAPLKTPIMVNAELMGEPSRLARMVASYPAPVILCSINGETLTEALAVAASLPNLLIETHELHVPGALRTLADRIGPERIVFGSGAPRRSLASSLYYVLYSELADDEKQLVLGGNIKRILEAA